MTTATFSGGPWAGELRELPGSGPPPAYLEIAVRPVLPHAWVERDDDGPPEMITPDIYRYVRHGYDTHTMLWVYVPETERRVRHPEPLSYGVARPSIKHWWCKACDVRWYGTKACWNCGQETGE